MESITITNPYGDSLTFTQDSNYRLLSRGDFGGTQVVNTTETGYLQRGTTLIQKRYGAKNLNLTLGLFGITQNDINNKIKQVSRLFEMEYNEKDDLSLFTIKFEKTGFNAKETKAYLNTYPSFLNTREDARGFYQRTFVSMTMPEPVWKDEEYTEVLLESQEDLFSFPLELSDSFVFGEVNEEGILINNQGDISTPLIIEFTGTSTNPLLENTTYNESLKLDTTIADGDTVTIDTSYINPRVEITSGGVTTNAFQYINPNNSDLNMMLRRGNNLIKYSSDDASTSIATLKYKKAYLNPLSGD